MGHEALNQVIDEVPPILSASPMLNVEVLFFSCFGFVFCEQIIVLVIRNLIIMNGRLYGLLFSIFFFFRFKNSDISEIFRM